MKPNELQQQIRFNLAQLSATNGSTDFEKICLFFARRRIHANVLPATGPVQSGGDQGRDFETFHSYLASLNRLNNGSYFIGKNFSKNPVAFACSLEKKPTKKNGKIASDVKAIMSSGSVVDRIYFFSGVDIPVAQRHQCQKEIKEKYNVELEIIDAQGLSLHLTDGDLFWVAVQFLNIPSESYPIPMEENWYSDLLKEYKKREALPSTFEEFTDIKAALRYIYKDDDLKKDLPFWLSKLDLIISNDRFVEPLVRKAIYEKFVASIVGLDNVEGQEENIIKYFSNFEDYFSPAELEDAQILFSFCLTAYYKGRHNLALDFLIDISQRLEKILLGRVTVVENIDTKAFLIETHASFIFNEFGQHPQIRLNKFVNRLNDILSLLPDTRYYPIERLADRLNDYFRILLPLKLNLKGLERFAEKIDIILSKKGGSDIVAEKLRARASYFIENGEILKAIASLHGFKIHTFNAESIKRSILSCLLLSRAYATLDLFFASKYYGLIAAFLAFNTKDIDFHTYFQKGLSRASDCDYASGAWLSYLNLVDFIIHSHFGMTKDFDVYDNDDSERILLYPSIVKRGAQIFLPEVLPHIDEKISKWGFIKQDIDGIQAKITLEYGDFSEKVKEQVCGRPFNDVGKQRKIDFNALGCDWHFSCDNEYVLNATMEEFVATFQIILADLYDQELYIIPSDVVVELAQSESKMPHVERPSENEEHIWKIQLPVFKGGSDKELSDHEFHYYTIAQTIIFEISLLPREKFNKVLKEKIIKTEILNKVSFGRPYSELFFHFNSEDEFNALSRTTIKNMQNESSFVPQRNKHLPYVGSLAPNYSHAESMKLIHKRISSFNRTLSITLPLLKSLEPFKKTINSLRAKGWLDWQILHSIAMIIMNYKAQSKVATGDVGEYREVISNFFRKDEKEWFQPIPIESLLTLERIEQDLKGMMAVTFLPAFELENHSHMPNTEGILRLLRERYNFFEDGKELFLFD